MNSNNPKLMVTVGKPPTASPFLRRAILGQTALQQRHGEQFAYIWDTEAANLLASIKHGEVITQVAFSRDGQRVATTGSDRLVRVWDSNGNELQRLSHEDAVTTMAFLQTVSSY